MSPGNFYLVFWFYDHRWRNKSSTCGSCISISFCATKVYIYTIEYSRHHPIIVRSIAVNACWQLCADCTPGTRANSTGIWHFPKLSPKQYPTVQRITGTCYENLDYCLTYSRSWSLTGPFVENDELKWKCGLCRVVTISALTEYFRSLSRHLSSWKVQSTKVNEGGLWLSSLPLLTDIDVHKSEMKLAIVRLFP